MKISAILNSETQFLNSVKLITYQQFKKLFIITLVRENTDTF